MSKWFGRAVNFQSGRSVPKFVKNSKLMFSGESLVVERVSKIHKWEEIGVISNEISLGFIDTAKSDVSQIHRVACGVIIIPVFRAVQWIKLSFIN